MNGTFTNSACIAIIILLSFILFHMVSVNHEEAKEAVKKKIEEHDRRFTLIFEDSGSIGGTIIVITDKTTGLEYMYLKNTIIRLGR